MPEHHGLIGPNSRNVWRADGRSVTLARPRQDACPVAAGALLYFVADPGSPVHA